MTCDELTAARRSLGLSGREMTQLLGVVCSLRQVQDKASISTAAT